MMKSRWMGPAVVILVLAAAFGAAAAADVEIPYTKFVLDNGLTLIVHEDHKAPIVAVNVWYHVGSKNEKPGKTGFAHLFEHLMFNGSENYNDDYFKPFDRIGATGMNGTTNFDRTNYFENVADTALDTALWMESDRMGHLLGAIDQAKLDEQRGVVQNEKRQGENQPYGQAFRMIFEGTYPAGHPYSWSVIGSMEDLDAASLDDVHEWFKTYYGAANAVLSIAGDIDTETVRRKVEEYFGDIPPGPPVTRQQAWIAKRAGERRAVLEDRVPQARIYKAWNIPEVSSPDNDMLDMVSSVLSSGKTSRLYKRLVYDDQIATDARAFVYPRELGGLFVLTVTAQPGQDLAVVEKALDEEMARFIAGGPTTAELERVKTGYRADFIRGVERIGGFGGKSDILAQGEVYAGDPGFYRTRLGRVAKATATDLQSAAVRWLSDGVFVLEVHPFPEYRTKESPIDRSKLPEPASWPEVSFPDMKTATLSNGLKVIVAERRAVPLITFDLVLDAGYAADQLGIPGAASLALDMLDEGTTSRSSLEISEALERLGASMDTGSTLDSSSVGLTALRENLGPSLDIYADVILHPSFSDKEFARLKKQRLAAIKREQSSPNQIAQRVLPELLYGKGHAYGLSFTGSGTLESVGRIGRDDLAAFHGSWFRPNNATLVVVGDTTLAELTPALERLFRDWKPGDVPKKNLARVEPKASSVVYLIDRPGSIQSTIVAGQVVPPKSDPHDLAIEAMNGVLGGSFTGRINMNLREDKHWSYGARSQVVDARGQRPFFVRAPVQTDKTAEAMNEIRKELQGIVSDKPPTADEVATIKDKSTLTLPGRWETSGAILDSIEEIVEFGLADDYWKRYPSDVGALDQPAVAAAAKQVLAPDKVVWVVVGDRAKIEAGIREQGFAEIRLIDADGNPVGAK